MSHLGMLLFEFILDAVHLGAQQVHYVFAVFQHKLFALFHGFDLVWEANRRLFSIMVSYPRASWNLELAGHLEVLRSRHQETYLFPLLVQCFEINRVQIVSGQLAAIKVNLGCLEEIGRAHV